MQNTLLTCNTTALMFSLHEPTYTPGTPAIKTYQESSFHCSSKCIFSVSYHMEQREVRRDIKRKLNRGKKNLLINTENKGTFFP